MKPAMALVLVSLIFVLPGSAAEPDSRVDLFERQVRPLLVEHCQRCHGAKKQMGGLRLDSQVGLLAGGENGPVVVAGNPDASTLIQAIRRTGERKMPPRDPLPPSAVEAFTHWVRQGVVWPASTTSTPAQSERTAAASHWAFRPPLRSALPHVNDLTWSRTPIDRFILARLEAMKLAPAPEAGRGQLLRRLSFDLIGLPPTPEEVLAFEQDDGPAAYERLVERLLASPHYGERWGRYWLDVARYADTMGYVFFQDSALPWGYTYRDYVLRAFNEDLPYNRFVCEQLAADRLDLGSDRRPLAGLGFLTVGGRFMNNTHDIIDDRIDVVCRGLLGLTVACARCHDHKFDPIPTADYYSLHGVFANSIEPLVPPLFEEPPRTAGYEKFARELRLREHKYNEFVQQQYQRVRQEAKTRAAEYLLAVHALRGKPRIDDFMLLADGNDLVPFMIARWQGYLERTAKSQDPVWAAWHRLTALPEKDLAQRLDELCTAQPSAIHPAIREALLVAKPKTVAELARVYGQALNRDDTSAALANVLDAPDSPPGFALHSISELELFPDRPSQGKLQELRKAIEAWRAKGPDAPPRAMALQDATAMVESRILIRGNPNTLGQAVPRRYLEALSPAGRTAFQDGSGRLDLAKAITDPSNPLTARVLVNRLWLHHFGAGLVRTPSDFGLRGEPPSHPELLDWLATEFIARRWSIKEMHRQIVLSATYRQSSAATSDALAKDPENVLLSRMNRRRLDFEAMRDALLAVSGRLDGRVGGPSERDPWAAGARRRTVYSYLDRLTVPGLFRTFDFPNPDATCPQRDSTTVAPQALFLMNHAFSRECARRFLDTMGYDSRAPNEAQVRTAYFRAYGRPPNALEVTASLDYLKDGRFSRQAWENYVQALLLANEFCFVD